VTFGAFLRDAIIPRSTDDPFDHPSATFDVCRRWNYTSFAGLSRFAQTVRVTYVSCVRRKLGSQRIGFIGHAVAISCASRSEREARLSAFVGATEKSRVEIRDGTRGTRREEGAIRRDARADGRTDGRTEREQRVRILKIINIRAATFTATLRDDAEFKFGIGVIRCTGKTGRDGVTTHRRVSTRQALREKRERARSRRKRRGADRARSRIVIAHLASFLPKVINLSAWFSKERDPR